MSSWADFSRTLILVGGLFFPSSLPGHQTEAESRKLAKDVVEKVVDGKRTITILDEQGHPIKNYTVFRPQTVFLTTGFPASVKEQGFVIYHRQASDEVFEDSVPRRGEWGPAETKLHLRTLITPGEKRHVQFAVYALQDLGRMDVSVTDLVSEQGCRISRETIDIRVVKSMYRRLGLKNTCHLVPHLLVLPKHAPPVEKERTRQFWLTIAVPTSTAAGVYKGKITMGSKKGPAGELALVVEVPDFTLVGPMWWGMYYYAGWNGPVTRRVFQDMQDHGPGPQEGHRSLGVR